MKFPLAAWVRVSSFPLAGRMGLMLAVCLLMGCGGAGDGRPKPLVVTGTVTFQSAAVDAGTVNFEEATKGYVGSSPLSSSGAYRLEVPAGTYKVSIVPPMEQVPMDTGSPMMKPKDVANIPAKSRDFTTSGLSATVATGSVKHDFALVP